MTTSSDVRDLLTHVSDLIYSEPDLKRRAELVGEFRHESRRIGQSLLAKTGYELREQRTNLNDVSAMLRAARSTINRAVLDYCAVNHLKPPRGFTRQTIDPDQIVTLPPRKGE